MSVNWACRGTHRNVGIDISRAEELENLFLVGAGTHPGPGLPGVLASAEILDDILPDVRNVANKKVYSTNKKVVQV